MEVILGDKPSCRPTEILDSYRQEAASSVTVDGEDTECDNITGKEELKLLLTLAKLAGILSRLTFSHRQIGKSDVILSITLVLAYLFRNKDVMMLPAS